MNKITLKIGKNGTYKNISELIQKVSITGRRGDAPRTLSATLFDSEQFARASANSGEGQQVFFYCDKSEIFRGLLMTDSRSSKRTLTIKAYDNCVYLCNNKGSFSFKKKSATSSDPWEMAQACVKKNLTIIGSCYDIPQKHAMFSGELLDVGICAEDENGDRFWCHFKSDSVEVMKRRYERYQEQKKRKRMKRSTERRRPLGEQGPIRYGAEYEDDWTL